MLLPIHVAAGGLALVLGAVALSRGRALCGIRRRCTLQRAILDAYYPIIFIVFQTIGKSCEHSVYAFGRPLGGVKAG